MNTYTKEKIKGVLFLIGGLFLFLTGDQMQRTIGGLLSWIIQLAGIYIAIVGIKLVFKKSK